MTARTVPVDQAVAMELERERQLSALEARMLAGPDVTALASRLRLLLSCDDGWGDGVLVPRDVLRGYLDATAPVVADVEPSGVEFGRQAGAQGVAAEGAGA
jgi:hypothetical protein